MEMISCTDRVRNEAVFLRVKDKNILHSTKIRKSNWICHMLCRNCLLKRINEGMIEGGIEVEGT